MNTDAELVIKSLRERGARFSLEGDRILVAPTELLSDEDRARIRAHKDGIISILRSTAADKPEDAGTPDRRNTVADPAAAILAVARAGRRLEAARQLLSVFQENGVGFTIPDGRPTILSNDRLCTSWLAAAQFLVAEILQLLPNQQTGCAGTINVIGIVRASPPPPIEVTRYLSEPIWASSPSDDEIKKVRIEGALRAAATHRTAGAPSWSSEQLDRARAKLEALLEVGDRIESTSDRRITVAKRGGEKIEVHRFDD